MNERLTKLLRIMAIIFFNIILPTSIIAALPFDTNDLHDSWTKSRTAGGIMLRHTGKTSPLTRSKLTTIPTIKSLNNTVISFKLRMPQNAKGTFTINAMGKNQEYHTLLLHRFYCRSFDKSPSSTKVHHSPLIYWKHFGIQQINDNEWHEFLIKTTPTSIGLWLKRNNSFCPVYETAHKGDINSLNIVANGSLELLNLTFDNGILPETKWDIKDGFQKALTPAIVEIPVNTSEISTDFRLGKAGIKLILTFNDNTEWETLIRSCSDYSRVKDPISKKWVKKILEDTYVKIDNLKLKHYIKPDVRFYRTKERNEILNNYENLPGADTATVNLKLQHNAESVEFWVDGRYAGRCEPGKKLTKIGFRLAEQAAIGDIKQYPRLDTKTYLPLDMPRHKLSKKKPELSITLTEKLPVPFAKLSKTHIDVGAHKEMSKAPELENDKYLSRNAFNGMPEHCLYSVPKAPYYNVHFLYIIDPDKKRDPVLTARLTCFKSGGRGNAIADITTDLPGENANIVGTVQWPSKQGSISLPLYYQTLTIPIGKIQDLLYHDSEKKTDYLHFEFLGKTGKPGILLDQRHKPVANSKSAARIIATTLECAPVEMAMIPTQVGNIFHNDDKPETTLRLKCMRPGNYYIKYQISDINNDTLITKTLPVNFTANNNKKHLAIPLSMPELGYYSLKVKLLNAANKIITGHDASFALLGQDTRNAGYKSPYSAWCYGRAHRGTDDFSIIGPLFKKAGIRRSTLFPFNPDKSENDVKEWQLTLSQIPFPHRLVYHTKPLSKLLERYEKYVRDLTIRFPHCKQILMIHEGFHDMIPPELYGKKQSAKDESKEEKQFKRNDIIAASLSKLIREKFPQLKIVFGNSGSSCGVAAAFFRRHYPKELIDYLGNESPGRYVMPEVLKPGGAQGLWFLKETARYFNYTLPVTPCYEWCGNLSRETPEKVRAAWIVRRALLAHAYRTPLIPLIGLWDVGDSYYNSLWGGGSSCQRYPLLYPKPSYVAAAVLTRVLDSALFRRQCPTGSSTIYMLEFKRNNEFIYALWTPRANVKLKLSFNGDKAIIRTDTYGRNKNLNPVKNNIQVTVSNQPIYLTTGNQFQNASIVKSHVPLIVTPTKQQIIAPMNDAGKWLVEVGFDGRLDKINRQPGFFRFRSVNDEERGPCLELVQEHKKTINMLTHEYVTLKLRKPIQVSGTPSSVSIDIKGNSSWGRIYWTLIDSLGQCWASCYSGYGQDGQCLSYINFDDWGTIQFPLNKQSRVPLSLNNVSGGVWQSDGNQPMTFPVSFTGLIIEMPRQSINLTTLSKVRPTIRLKNITVFE